MSTRPAPPNNADSDDRRLEDAAVREAEIRAEAEMLGHEDGDPCWFDDVTPAPAS